MARNNVKHTGTQTFILFWAADIQEKHTIAISQVRNSKFCLELCIQYGCDGIICQWISISFICDAYSCLHKACRSLGKSDPMWWDWAITLCINFPPFRLTSSCQSGELLMTSSHLLTGSLIVKWKVRSRKLNWVHKLNKQVLVSSASWEFDEID